MNGQNMDESQGVEAIGMKDRDKVSEPAVQTIQNRQLFSYD